MKIKSIELHPVVVPMREGTLHSKGLERPLHMLRVGASKGWTKEFHQLTKFIIRIRLNDGTEGVSDSLRGESSEASQAIAASLIGADPRTFNLFDLPVPYSREFDGFESALFDLIGKIRNQSVSDMLGGRFRDRVACSGWWGHMTPEDCARRTKYFHGKGFSSVKYKSNLLDNAIHQCAAIKKAVPSMKVIVDPNMRWERAAEALRLCHDLREIGNVWCLEDPIPRWDIDGWRHLRATGGIPLALHTHLPYIELFQKPQDPVLAWKANAIDYFNFSGPMSWVMRMAHFAELVNVPFWHGSELDFGFLEASYLHVAAACKMCTLPSDIFSEAIREDDLIKKPLEYDGKGNYVVPKGPGLGVELDESALKHYRQGKPIILS